MLFMMPMTEWLFDVTMGLIFITVLLFAINEGMKSNQWKAPTIAILITFSLVFSAMLVMHRTIESTINRAEAEKGE